MEDVLRFIQKRRSIRRYKAGAEVSEAQVETLLRAAMSAPSAGNQQPWHFIVVRDRAKLEGIMTVHPYASMLKTASLAIVVCGDLARQQHEGYWPQDCAAATQNLLLAAANMGLGTCWCGAHPRPEREAGLRKLLGIPDSVVPFAVVAVGVPAEERGPADYFDPARIHKEAW